MQLLAAAGGELCLGHSVCLRGRGCWEPGELLWLAQDEREPQFPLWVAAWGQGTFWKAPARLLARAVEGGSGSLVAGG